MRRPFAKGTSFAIKGGDKITANTGAYLNTQNEVAPKEVELVVIEAVKSNAFAVSAGMATVAAVSLMF